MIYKISRYSIPSQYIQISLIISCRKNEVINLQVAKWRPGRYDLIYYAQKIRAFSVSFENEEIPWKRITTDQYEFCCPREGQYKIDYEFYANQMDAGGSWSDDQQLYLNFSNFIFEVLQRKNEEIELNALIPSTFKIATALPYNGVGFEAENYQHIIDSPFLASKDLKNHEYTVGHTIFYMWFHGDIHFDLDGLSGFFEAFTRKQIDAFGEFPADEYHFIFQLLPYAHFHGVEHKFSTVITFGPSENLNEKSSLNKLVGVSSHELYHFWNVCRIRPRELLSYDLSKEVLLDMGLVLEGVTTYMGDLFLLKSGYYSLEEYLRILEKFFVKEFETQGWQNQSIVESSMDLWLDGYKGGIPDKKVSIYNRGALISLCLDLMLLDHQCSLQQVMKEMWVKFGKEGRGYSLADFNSIITSKFLQKENIEHFFNTIVYGREDLLPFLHDLLPTIGITIEMSFSSNELKHHFGFNTTQQGQITNIHPEAKAYHKLMLGDQIMTMDNEECSHDMLGQLKTLTLLITRWARKIEIKLEQENKLFFPEYRLLNHSSNSKRDHWMK